jgi:phosphatidylinositol glycan class O
MWPHVKSNSNSGGDILLQGGLPTFLDVGQSFSASAITEDNLLQQLLTVNKTLVG